MDMCIRCEKNGNEVRLLDGISGTEIVKICERCSIIEGIPLIKKPTTSQLRDAEKTSTMEQRLRRIAGLDGKEEKHESIFEQMKKLDAHPEFEKPDKKSQFNLIDNFHWHIQRARRNRGLSHKQVAWALGESEAALKMIEHGDLPEDSEKLIKKLEQFFQIKIRERSFQEQEEEKRIHIEMNKIHHHPHKHEFNIKFHDRMKGKDILHEAKNLKNIEKGFLIFVEKEGKELFVPIHRVKEILHKGKSYWKH